MIRENGITPHAWCRDNNVRIDVLTGNKGIAIVFTNSINADTETVFYISDNINININESVINMTDIFTGDTIEFERENGYLCGKIKIEAQSCLCYIAAQACFGEERIK